MSLGISTFCLIIMATLMSVNGSAIDFTSTSTSIKPLITTNVTLRCSLHDTNTSVSGSIVGRKRRETSDWSTEMSQTHTPAVKRQSLTNTSDNVDFVTSMVISKDGMDIATLSEHFPAKSVIGSSDLHVTGHLQGQPGERGFLQLTWKHPTQQQTGNYRCDVTALNKLGHSVSFSKTLDVTDEEITMNDLVGHVGDLTKTIETMDKEMTSQNQEISTLQQEITSQNQEITTLHQENHDLVSQMTRTNTKVFFSAILSRGFLNLPTGQVILFDQVITNEGGAYQPGSGIFTSPVDGFYNFVIHAVNEGSLNFYLELQHNNKQVVDLLSENTKGYSGSSNSAIIKVIKGETVKVVTTYSTSHIYSTSYLPGATSFSGHLIAVV